MYGNRSVFFVSVFLLVLISAFTELEHIAKTPNQKGDIYLWQNVVDRMRSGVGYYDAMEAALRTCGNYPLRPFWSFRLPTLASFQSRFTDRHLKAILALLCIIMAMCWLCHLKTELPSLIIAIFLFSFILIGTLSDYMTVWHDHWAGILIALSIGIYPSNRVVSIIAGLAALSLRIHVVPFIIVMAVFSWLERKKRESLVWVAGLLCFALYVGLHAYLVSGHVKPGDLTKSWTAAGGWPFVISTTRFTITGILGLTKLSAILLPVVLTSLFIWNHPSARRAAFTMLSFICAFMVMGNPDNNYWGLLYSPLYAVGLAYSPRAVRDMKVRVENKK